MKFVRLTRFAVLPVLVAGLGGCVYYGDPYGGPAYYPGYGSGYYPGYYPGYYGPPVYGSVGIGLNFGGWHDGGWHHGWR